PLTVVAQEEVLSLSLEQSMTLLQQENKNLQIAGKGVEWARSEQQKLQSFWYPSLFASGAFVHLSNPVEARQPLNQFTDPAKDYLHSILPDDRLISSLLDKIGSYTLTFPLVAQNITSVDANLTWPLFTGGKRIYAAKIGKAMVQAAEVNRNQVDAAQQTLLIQNYFALRLGQRVEEVRTATYASLQTHYSQALKLEQNGMINRAECLLAEVSRDEAKRELESSRKELKVARQALKSLIGLSPEQEVSTTTPLFINTLLPPIDDFRTLVPGGNYMVNQLKLQEAIAGHEGKIARSAYMPNIALFGKQTLYAHGVDKYLMPRTMVGVGFTWTLFDGLDREKRIKQAKLTVQSLSLGRQQAVTDLEVAIDKFYSQLQNALDDVAALRTTVRMSDELLRIRKRSFQEGMATSAEVVDAEVMLTKVRVAMLLAYYAYDVALINLLTVCGTPQDFASYRHGAQTEQTVFTNE
ncbi:MAG: TolC family protein, partial [Tannerellaceae bacterium]